RGATTALPHHRQSVREYDRGAILDIDRRETLQEWDGYGVSRDDPRYRGTEHLLQTGRSGRRKTLIKRLGRDRHTERRGRLGQFPQGRLRIAQKAKDQGLTEGRAAQRGGAMDKLRRLGGGIRGRGQNLAHGTGNLWYGGSHGEAPFL